MAKGREISQSHNYNLLCGRLDIVHAVSYSLLLLNTDLHIADHNNRMSRNQFVRNTLDAIQEQIRPTASTAYLSQTDLTYDDSGNSVRGGVACSDGTEIMAKPKRSDSITSWNSVSREGIVCAISTGGKPTANDQVVLHQANGSTPSVAISAGDTMKKNAANPLYKKGWEFDMEALLKVRSRAFWSLS